MTSPISDILQRKTVDNCGCMKTEGHVTICLTEAEQAILQLIAETIGKDETHPNGSKLVNPWTCDDCGTPQEEFTRNKLRDEIRAKLGITGEGDNE